MSVQQCLACNAMVDQSSRSCDCGHVFEDFKQIAGKRFSEYRAELYWRIENKRMKVLSKENQPMNKMSADLNNNINKDIRDIRRDESDKETGTSSSDAAKVSRKRFLHGKVKRCCSAKTLYRSHIMTSQQAKSTSTCSKDQPVSPEVLRRLSQALEEINKKIQSQNLMWKTLL